MAVANIDKPELEARRLVRNWGGSLTVVHHRPASPCPRRYCGGSIMASADGGRCLLCARASENGSNGRVSSAEIEALMTAAPGPVRGLRASAADKASYPLGV